MSPDSLRQIVTDGLPALLAGTRIAAGTADDVQNDATDPGLKAALTQGEETTEQWQARIERAIGEAGATDPDGDNAIVRAVCEVAAKIRTAAPDSTSRDLGIIASGQLALHYWIASFGSMDAYAEQAGLSQTASEMSRCADEAGEADKAHTALATQILRA